MMRTHNNGALRKKDIKKAVTLCGWIHSIRDHGGVIFIDLRDRYGFTQVVFNPEHNKKIHEESIKLKREDVIQVTGTVVLRSKDTINLNMPTGEVEVVVNQLNVLAKSKTPPIEIDEFKPAGEEARLKYRYLDLRKTSMKEKIEFRHKIAQSVREYLNKQDFLEIETPFLIKSTPEGARDYIVPSRIHAGKFYALPQSPQIYKQLLMMSGLDKYYQLARCMRDEDLRADRQPEFTQIDLEMSFVTEEDIYSIIEELIKHVFKTVGKKTSTPFQRISYTDSINKYGVDKPDIRYGLEFIDVTDAVKYSDFQVFKDVIKKNGIIKCINPNKDFGRKELDLYIEYAQNIGAKGMAWMKVTKKGLESNIVKYFTKEIQDKILKTTKAKTNSTLMFIAGHQKRVHHVLAELRKKISEDLKLYNPEEFAFCWINNFPLFEKNEETGKLEPAHHMFCKPKEGHEKLLKNNPEKVICTQYDLVLNGIELGSGSLRINEPKLQEQVMDAIGMNEKEKQQFSFFLEALSYGAPPHGGIALGFDRLVALLIGLHDIREVIAFPKNKAAESLVDGAPTFIDEQLLKDAHIKNQERQLDMN
ncbi:aspartate--tRNA ligase [Candidatus Woesearchaeota archaeon]|nr:aspartate--tRNA ligase [Candidatus Woesearchaeota archaeon]